MGEPVPGMTIGAVGSFRIHVLGKIESFRLESLKMNLSENMESFLMVCFRRNLLVFFGVFLQNRNLSEWNHSKINHSEGIIQKCLFIGIHTSIEKQFSEGSHSKKFHTERFWLGNWNLSEWNLSEKY
jgi:hypothetical protein